MPTTPVATFETFVGLGLETTKGTAAAGTIYLPLDTFEPADDYDQLLDEASRGSNAGPHDVIQGVGRSTYDMGGPIMPDSFGAILGGLLGDVATTGTTPKTHVMAAINSGAGQPKAWTIHDSDAVQPRKFPGCQFSETTIKINSENLAAHSTKALGYLSATETAPVPAWTAVQPLAGWRFVASVGGSPVLTLLDAEWSIRRETNDEHPITGTQGPGFVWGGQLVSEGKLTFVLDAETELARYLAGTSVAIDLAATQGAGAGQTGLTLHASKAYYFDTKRSRGQKFQTIETGFRCANNATDAGATGGFSPVKATIISALASGSYA